MSERNTKNGNDGKDSSHSKMPGDNKNPDRNSDVARQKERK